MPAVEKQLGRNSPPGISNRAVELRTRLRLFPVETLANATGSQYTYLGSGSGEFHLPLFDAVVTGSYPEFKFFSALGDELPDFYQLLLLYYFATADGMPLTGKFVTFADLPGGRMYANAFQAYAGDEIVKVFGEKIEEFKFACQRANGVQLESGDAAFSFLVLPKVAVQVVYWLGDEDFPSACRILFDAATTHYLPIDVCAIIGSNLVQRIIKKNPTK
ncbi:MAG TPA: DUF3786 domain-containing protein [Anaerolineales bacterium]